MEIILLRHGKPVLPSLDRITAHQFGNWVKNYNTAALSPSSLPTPEAIQAANKCNTIVCSALLRSQESANALNKEKVMLSHSIFNEADLPVADWKLLKLSPKFWAFLFRILWLIGYSKNAESFKVAKIRAERATDKLISICQEQDSVLFVGHGVYNKLLANVLKKRGWLGDSHPGSSHWAHSIYRINSNQTP